MKRVIVHCGMHKTGSSSIQNTLRDLETPDVIYAGLGRTNHSAPIITMFSTRPEAYHGHKKLGRTKKEIDQLRRWYLGEFNKALKSKQDTVIVSAEDLSSASFEVLSGFHRFVCDNNRIPEYCCYVRDPIGFANSQYQQMSKGNPNAKFNEIIKYQDIFSKFLQLYNAKDISVWKFDPGSFQNGSVVQDFSARVGISNICPSEKRANESLSDTAAKLVYIFNKTFPVSTGDRKLFKARMDMVEALSREFKGPSFKFPIGYITEDMIDWQDISYLKEKFGIDFEPEIREQLPKDSKFIDDTTFDTYMRHVSGDVREKLRNFLDRLDVPCPEDRVPKMLARLYLHFVQAQASSG